MGKKNSKKTDKSVVRGGRGDKKQSSLMENLRLFIRQEGGKYLKDPNITSIGVGRKIKNGKVETDSVCVQFTVDEKVKGTANLGALGTTKIPKVITIKNGEGGAINILTDVIKRKYRTSHKLTELESKSPRKTRIDPIKPGVSVGHQIGGVAGTLGAIVYERHSGKPCILSNWHVLQGETGMIGDEIVQPGVSDDNRGSNNLCGKLVRSYLGEAGDCAIARIQNRGIESRIQDLNVPVTRIAEPHLDDKVVKSGRSTAVTYGIVRRVDVLTKVDYQGSTGIKNIGGFEIGPDPDNPAPNNEISESGDSGSIWLIAGENKEIIKEGIMVGLHFAGEGNNNPDDHALACYAKSVFEKLEIIPAQLSQVEIEGIAQDKNLENRTGFDESFLKFKVPAPKPIKHVQDIFKFYGSHLIPYTHFSVCLSQSRRMARYVAWNIDGGSLQKNDRKGLKFKYDSRIKKDFQIGDEAYSDNKLDRGHIARRADLVWGGKIEAQEGNVDSFYFTNITPQHRAFNQSSKQGLWGLLENAVYDDVKVENLRISVIGGPVLRNDDIEYRGIQIPKDYWKLLAYTDSEDGKNKVKAFVLTQNDLLDDIEALSLEPFRIWQVSLSELSNLTGLSFDGLAKYETIKTDNQIEALGKARKNVREIHQLEDFFVEK